MRDQQLNFLEIGEDGSPAQHLGALSQFAADACSCSQFVQLTAPALQRGFDVVALFTPLYRSSSCIFFRCRTDMVRYGRLSVLNDGLVDR